MEGKKRRFPWRAARWERMLLTAVATVLSGEVFFNLGNDNFRISGAVVIFPVLLLTLVQDGRMPLTGILTGVCLLLVRSAVNVVGGGESWMQAILLNYPAAVFYPCYDALLCLLIRDRYQAPLSQLWWTFWLCDGVSNAVNFSLANGGIPDAQLLVWLTLIALARALLAALILWGMKRYRRLLLAEEHERRYQRLFLMTANLKNELYFLKKDAENIEGIMSRAYRLYERLGELDCPEEVRQLALSIARDVHEVKKDNLSIVRGIEGEVAGTGTDQGEQMWMSDLFLILQDTMRHILGEQRKDIDLYATLKPAKEVGGDLYDFFIHDEKLLFVIGDVSGKGIPASLLMAVTRSLFRTIATHRETAKEIVSALNRAVADNNEANMFITLFVGILDLQTGELGYCNAGHNPPVLSREGEDAHFLSCHSNIPIGVFEDFEYTEEHLPLGFGRMLLLYTDGLTEAENREKALYSDARLLETMQALKGLGAQETIDALGKCVQDFANGAEQSDDLTMLALQLKPINPNT